MKFFSLVPLFAILAVRASAGAASRVEPKFSTYTGFGTTYDYSQGVRMGQDIRLAGQGGWDFNGTISTNLTTEVQTTFHNIERALRAAGSKGLGDIIALKSYHVDNIQDALPIVTETMEELLGDLQPIWTAIGVTALAFPGQTIEIDVEAWASR
ncbi:hypothetical protein VE00_11130 [Pseudogymnoascus sp. WSF 3629]|nr:hypothetical protein VE00_11130 [Pseudogymnoascus sp. WSF 3629]